MVIFGAWMCCFTISQRATKVKTNRICLCITLVVLFIVCSLILDMWFTLLAAANLCMIILYTILGIVELSKTKPARFLLFRPRLKAMTTFGYLFYYVTSRPTYLVTLFLDHLILLIILEGCIIALLMKGLAIKNTVAVKILLNPSNHKTFWETEEVPVIEASQQVESISPSAPPPVISTPVLTFAPTSIPTQTSPPVQAVQPILPSAPPAISAPVLTNAPRTVRVESGSPSPHAASTMYPSAPPGYAVIQLPPLESQSPKPKPVVPFKNPQLRGEKLSASPQQLNTPPSTRPISVMNSSPQVKRITQELERGMNKGQDAGVVSQRNSAQHSRTPSAVIERPGSKKVAETLDKHRSSSDGPRRSAPAPPAKVNTQEPQMKLRRPLADLATELQLPELIQVQVYGITTQSFATMTWDEAKGFGITQPTFIRMKKYLNSLE
jgi:hypothetical protein